MTTYATVAELTQRYGTIALNDLLPSDATDSLAVLAGQALVEAAGEIDAVLAGAGYATPVDTSAITDSDQQARAEAVLRRLEIGLTVAALSHEAESHLRSEKDASGMTVWGKISSDASWARSFLGLLRTRKASLPGITSPGRTFVRHSGAAVPSADDVTDRNLVAGAW